MPRHRGRIRGRWSRIDHYLALEGTQITRANAEERMLAKLTRDLTDDVAPLLSAGVVYGDAEAQEAFERVMVGRRTRRLTLTDRRSPNNAAVARCTASSVRSAKLEPDGSGRVGGVSGPSTTTARDLKRPSET